MGVHTRSAESVKGRRRGGLGTVFAIIVLLVGAVVLFLPDIQNFFNQRSMDAEIEKFDMIVEDMASGQPEATAEDAAKYEALYPLFTAYNESLRENGQSPNDPFAYSEQEAEFAELGIPDGLIGSISIPAMDVNLPLYFNSTYEHMDKGATVIAGTSLPLGEADSNCVIAAHRGWSGKAMFRDIMDLEVGDTVTIRTPYSTLVYRVEGFKLINPNACEELFIQPGRDMITLFTCHPWSGNTHRILVFCARDHGDWVAPADGEGVAAGLDAMSTFDEATGETGMSALEIEKLLKRCAGIVVIVVLLIVIIHAIADGARRRRSERMSRVRAH